MIEHVVPTRGIGLTGAPPLVPSFGFGLSPVEAGAGKRRWVLPDGRIVDDPTVAYAELEKYLRARAAELDAESPPSPRKVLKRKRSRSIHPKPAPRLLAQMPVPQIIERLPEAERARIDLELVALAHRLARERDDEEAITLLLN